jgi:formiminoglutamase
MKNFVPFTAIDIERYLPQRFDLTLDVDFEKEDHSPVFAEKIEICTDDNNWSEITADYVLIGIPEDIGVRANMGRPGTDQAWKNFLNTFLRLPHNIHNDATRFCVLGEIMTADLMQQSEHLDAAIHADRIKLSDLVLLLDQRVSEVIHAIRETGKTPIIIGGGHNNCFPILRAYGYSTPVDCINIDAHTDLRNTKGRHSGNGFSHAIEQGFLNNYFMIGIQKNYLSDHMINNIQNNEAVDYSPFTLSTTGETIHVEKALNYIDDTNYGLEIDMDVVANFPSSAQSPVGLSVGELRVLFNQILNQASELPKYIHFCEAAPVYGYSNQVGKTLSAIICDLP